MEISDRRVNRIAVILTALASVLEEGDRSDTALIAKVCHSKELRRKDLSLIVDVTLGFWDTRIAVSGTAQTSTRIPHIPDQSDFIRQWFDWHRGYAIIRKPDGTEESQELIGEALSEVELGRLPRTLEELQARPEPRRHRLRRRLAEASAYTESSDTVINNDGHYLQNINTQQHVTSTSMIHSHPTLAPLIDPEDRIFDSSSESTSPANSDTGDYRDGSIPARQRLLSNLQQNLDDVRANVLELTQRTPGARNASQVSSVTSQINAITRRLSRIRQQNLSRLPSVPSNETMSSPGPNPDLHNPDESDFDGSELDRMLMDGPNEFYTDEELRQRIMQLNREESEARAALVGLGISPGRQGTARVREAMGRRQRAEQEQARRVEARLRSRREEMERHQGPITSLFARQPPTSTGTQDYINTFNNTVVASDGPPSDRNRVWTSRYGPLGAGRPGGGSTEASSQFAPTNYGFAGTCNFLAVTSYDKAYMENLRWLIACS